MTAYLVSLVVSLIFGMALQAAMLGPTIASAMYGPPCPSQVLIENVDGRWMCEDWFS